MKQGLLVITGSIDYTVDYVIDKFKDLTFYRLNVDMLNHYKIRVNNVGWEISTNTWSATPNNVKAILYRKPRLPDLSDYMPEYQLMIQKDIIALIDGIVNSFNGVVLSKPYLLRKTENKIYQLCMLKNITFPNSFIGNASEDIGLDSRNKNIIKPLTSGKIVSQEGFEIFQTNYINLPISDIEITPVYLQEYVDKQFEARITFVNGQLWPVRIDASNKIDWRKSDSKNNYSLIELPKEISDVCITVMTILNLKFGAIDFIIDNDDKWFFLEVNPNGQWLWLEKALNLSISNAIIDYLLGDE